MREERSPAGKRASLGMWGEVPPGIYALVPLVAILPVGI